MEGRVMRSRKFGKNDEKKDVRKGGPPGQAVCRPNGGYSRKDL